MFALTIDKGLTLLGAILIPLLHPSNGNLKKNGTLYVALSRMKHLVDLQVFESLSHIVLKYFQLGNVHLTEDTCLQALKHIT